MKIAVFDDNKKDLDKMLTIIRSWIQHHNYSDIVLIPYSDSKVLQFALSDFNTYDVFFLDIMTEGDRSAGFRLAESIHRINQQSIIIFTTNSQEYFENAFEISAFRYMLKPLDPSKVHATLDDAYSRVKIRRHKAFIFQCNRQKVVIERDQILYLESITTDHRAKLFQTDGSVIEISLSNRSFSNLIDDSLSSDFCQCHRSFIVNLNYVTHYGTHSVFLRKDTEIPVSSTYRFELTKRMIEHYKKVY